MKKTIKLICALMAIVCVTACLSSCLSASKKAEIAEVITKAEAADISEVNAYINALKPNHFRKADGETNYVMIEVKGKGKIVVALRPDTAPLTVANFKKLVANGFYDGLIFHRVINEFMVQGGGFTTNYKSKPADTITGEFASNGIENDLLHVRGVISMARTSVMDSASSQFFIMHADTESLDGEYAAFGYVIAGLSTVDKIASVPTYSNDYPQSNVVIKSVYFVEPIVD